jgi:hypothetical protein
MACAGDHLFKIALPIPKGSLGFAAALAHLFDKLLLGEDWAHAATATAPAGLKH